MDFKEENMMLCQIHKEHGDSSLYMRCNECQSFGTPMQGNTECGNCGSSDTVWYYDHDTVISALEGQREGCLKSAKEAVYERGGGWDEDVEQAILEAEVKL